jgi:hypothetical protein
MNLNKKNLKTRAIKLLITALVVFLSSLLVLFLASLFFDKYELGFQSPVKFQTPILIQERKEAFINPLVEPVAAWATSVDSWADDIDRSSLGLLPVQPEGEIEQEIYDVFGEKGYLKAMVLLKGRGEGTCAENHTLNPDAVNINSDGSKDYGIFQLNSNWHGFNKPVNNERYLYDPSINIRIAYKIYKASGESFNLWTCGRQYGL